MKLSKEQKRLATQCVADVVREALSPYALEEKKPSTAKELNALAKKAARAVRVGLKVINAGRLKNAHGLSSSFRPAEWRGTTNTDGELIGVSLDLADGQVARYALNLVSARMMAESIIEFAAPYGARTNSHSDSSPGIPSVEVSTPEECEKV
jgi:hypothetical protein